ncbi:helix-turn-helix domain-containing protein [Agaribacterium sp. ZY112]|uniref:helix-turn-helix domain-containing protein n=1 Tax=Agaribacterium sp. ZY112 TaxID=3233574 RepID=UPI003525A6FE
MIPKADFDPHKILEPINIGNFLSFYELFEETLFWIKDTQGRFVHANRALLNNLKVKSAEEIIGKDDTHITGIKLARSVMEDDQKVCHGEPVKNRLVLNKNKQGEFSWFITNKIPLKNKHDKTVAIMGISIPMEQFPYTTHRMESLLAPLQYIIENYNQKISIESLASIACISVSALERRFKKYLQKTPSQLIIEIRLEKARLLLKQTKSPITNIAEETGFYDHSNFTKRFAEYFGMTPIEYRSENSF